MNILLVDDEYLIRAKLLKYLRDSNFTFDKTFEASDGLEALEIIRNNPIDIAIIDIQMPKLTGIELLQNLRAESYQTNVIFLTGFERFEYARQATIDIAIIDIQMPKLTGIELLQNLRAESYQTNVIFLTGFERFEYARQAIKYNIVEYLLKPVKKSDLYTAIDKCISLIKKSDQNLVALKELDEKSKYQYIIDSLYNDVDITSSPLNIKSDNFILVSVELSKESYITDLYNFLNNNFKPYDVIYGISKSF